MCGTRQERPAPRRRTAIAKRRAAENHGLTDGRRLHRPPKTSSLRRPLHLNNSPLTSRASSPQKSQRATPSSQRRLRTTIDSSPSQRSAGRQSTPSSYRLHRVRPGAELSICQRRRLIMPSPVDSWTVQSEERSGSTQTRPWNPPDCCLGWTQDRRNNHGVSQIADGPEPLHGGGIGLCDDVFVVTGIAFQRWSRSPRR